MTPNVWLNSRLREGADDAGGLLDLAVERLDELVPRHAGLERGRLEVGGHQREGVVMQGAGRRARAEVMRKAHQALATDILIGLLAGLALGEAGHGHRNAIG